MAIRFTRNSSTPVAPSTKSMLCALVSSFGDDPDSCVCKLDLSNAKCANYIVPARPFSASGSQQIPESFANQIPSIAFAVPDLEIQARLELTTKHGGKKIACIQSELSNGRSMQVKGASYAAAGVAAGAFAMSGVSAAGVAGHAGIASTSPGFGDVMGWFHTMATTGMLSVNYPSVYRSFSKNFAFSTGLIPWGNMQQSIDSFRKSTGGNLTSNSYEFLQKATLQYSQGSSSNSSSKSKRDFDNNLVPRDGDGGGFNHVVSGMEAYAEQLTIPQANTFMTVLLIFAIVIASITVGILLFKLILELWGMYGKFPEKLSNFRKDYWGLLSRTITNLILVLYGIWVLYCVYQLNSGDSWAAKFLACITLVIFTGILLFFGIRIFYLARKYRMAEGDVSNLYEDKETWRKYSLFYDNYKKDCWWLFVPVILYMFIKGCIIAGGNGHGLAQTSGQLIVEALMLALLVWYRPYVAKSNQWINITIQVVRFLSVICVLIFVEELGLSQTTKTVTGIVLIVVQTTLTGILAILIVANAIILCVRENPHTKRRKEAGKSNSSTQPHNAYPMTAINIPVSTAKMGRDVDNLTPLDARESLLMDNPPRKEYAEMAKFNFTGPYEPYKDQVRSESRQSPRGSTDRLVDPPSYAEAEDHYARCESRQSRDSYSSLEKHRPIAPC